jgi:hypothetical protein
MSERKLIDYIVLNEEDDEELRNEIIKCSLDGYELCGGISVSYCHDKHVEGDWFYQAMVKYE